jgi:hypothetical protein
VLAFERSGSNIKVDYHAGAGGSGQGTGTVRGDGEETSM